MFIVSPNLTKNIVYSVSQKIVLEKLKEDVKLCSNLNKNITISVMKDIGMKQKYSYI